MAEASIALTLVLDALGAKEEASSLAKAVDGFADSFKRMGTQMENTMRGRLIKGVLGTFRSEFKNLMEVEVPQSIRTAELKIALLTKMLIATKIPPELAGPIARAGFGREIGIQQAALADTRRIFAGVRDLDPKQVGAFFKASLVDQRAVADRERALNKILVKLPPSIQADSKEITRRLSGAKSAIAAAGVELAQDPVTAGIIFAGMTAIAAAKARDMAAKRAGVE